MNNMEGKLNIPEWRKKYLARKKEIKISDDELWGPVFESMKKGPKIGINSLDERSLSEFSAIEIFDREEMIDYNVENDISGNLIFYQKITKGAPLINIGCGGEGGLFRANNSVLNGSRAEKTIVVDPYFKKEDMDKIIEDRQYNKTEFIEDDGLHYLVGLPDNSGNIFISNLGADVLTSGGNNNFPAKEWMERVSQEAYRIVPNGGCFILVNCYEEFENEAKKLFEVETSFKNRDGKYLKNPQTKIFIKKTGQEKEIEPALKELHQKMLEISNEAKILEEKQGDLAEFSFGIRNINECFDSLKILINTCEDHLDIKYYSNQIKELIKTNGIKLDELILDVNSKKDSTERLGKIFGITAEEMKLLLEITKKGCNLYQEFLSKCKKVFEIDIQD
ncbi:MAG: hypothetical protein WC241_03340 [Candidatus Paceibacterota bacterium]|jgi:hypothetical protein